MTNQVSYISLLQSKTHSHITKIVFIVFHARIFTSIGKTGKGGRFARYGKSKPCILLATKDKNMVQNPPYQLSPGAIRDFKELYLEEFKENLTDDEAEIIAMRVLRFFKILKFGKID